MGFVGLSQVDREFVLRRCRFFQDVQLWPLLEELDPKRWLSNFLDSEMDHAIHLLNAFMYFRQPLMDQLMRAAFQALSQLETWPSKPPFPSRIAWRSFLDNVLITRVTGEDPSDTDSGFRFQRMARQVLGIPENRILPPEKILRSIVRQGPRSVVFVDDFVGSGNQFRMTWERQYALRPSLSLSFQNLASIMPDNQFFYCPLICTEFGRQELSRSCPEAVICPAHFLPPQYSALVPDSIVWPEYLKDSAYAFLKQASARAGIPDTEWQGIGHLGLVLAFEHCVPDATLKIIYWNENGWKPLIERT